MYKHFTAANEYFVESKASMEYEPELVQALDTIFVGVTEVQRQVRDRAKLGSTAATSVPISLTGKKPKRSDILGRWSGLSKRDARLIPLPQPIFDNPAEDPSLPDYIFQRRAATSTVTTEASSIEDQPGPTAPVTTTAGQATPTATVATTAGQPAETATVATTAGQTAETATVATTAGQPAETTTVATTVGQPAETATVATTAGQPAETATVATTAGQPAETATVATTAGQPAETATVTTTPAVRLTSGSTSSDTTLASERIRPPPPPIPAGGVQISSSQSGRKKRKATKPPIIEDGELDDPERDPDFVILDQDLEEAEVQPSSSILSGLSQQESVEKGIPQLKKKGL